jgi:hypothetical protein
MQKQDEEKTPYVERENWEAEDLVEESSGESADETVRKVLRGNEKEGNADDRDVVGSVDSDETWQGREENKHEVEKNG